MEKFSEKGYEEAQNNLGKAKKDAEGFLSKGEKLPVGLEARLEDSEYRVEHLQSAADSEIIETQLKYRKTLNEARDIVGKLFELKEKLLMDVNNNMGRSFELEKEFEKAFDKAFLIDIPNHD